MGIEQVLVGIVVLLAILVRRCHLVGTPLIRIAESCQLGLYGIPLGVMVFLRAVDGSAETFELSLKLVIFGSDCIPVLTHLIGMEQLLIQPLEFFVVMFRSSESLLAQNSVRLAQTGHLVTKRIPFRRQASNVFRHDRAQVDSDVLDRPRDRAELSDRLTVLALVAGILALETLAFRLQPVTIRQETVLLGRDLLATRMLGVTDARKYDRLLNAGFRNRFQVAASLIRRTLGLFPGLETMIALLADHRMAEVNATDTQSRPARRAHSHDSRGRIGIRTIDGTDLVFVGILASGRTEGVGAKTVSRNAYR